MAKYVVLLNWTEQGRRTAKDTVTRFEQARDAFQQIGISFDTIVWTMGRYDMVAIVDAPDDETVAMAMAQLGSAGNVSTETLRGFTADEVRSLIQKMR